MCTDERVVGAVTFSFASPRRFSPSEREYLLAVTALCTQAFDRVRLLEAESSARADEERRLRWMTYLAEVGPLLEAPLAMEDRLQRLADLAASELADWCAVHLVRDDRVDRVAVAHVDPRKRAFVADLEARYPPDPDNPAGAIHVSRTGETVYVPEIPDEMLVQVARDAEHLDLIRSIGMRSAAVVPLVVRGTSLGALTLVQAESGRTIDRTDLAFIHQLAAGAAIALDNARLYEQQRTVADTLQRALLPEDVPSVPGMGLAARYRPYGPRRTGFIVGGDLYDVVLSAAGRFAVTVADVCGKGPPAAALTAMIRHTVRTEVRHSLGPEDVLRRLNGAMIEDAGTGVARFATAVHAHVTPDAAGADVTLVNAGHVAPLLLRDGEVSAVQSPGVLLGVYPDVSFTPVDLRLLPGDTLVLFTDGVTEARGVDGFYGEERLAGLLGSLAGRSAEEVADAVIADVTAFDGGDSRDDMVVLVLQAGT
jgi:serine phosphatase RsbU (regulator of sigma subunit)